MKKVTATKASLGRRRLVFGVGINDADYQVRPKPTKGGKQNLCPFYNRWAVMIKRCYSDSFKLERSIYNDLTVCKEWLAFSSFKEWMTHQPWEGNDMSSTIIDPSNKVYSPEKCRFVTRNISQMIEFRRPRPSNVGLPTGVSPIPGSKKFVSSVSDGGKSTYLGVFKSKDLAGAAYKKAKIKIITRVADEQSDQSIANGLMRHAELLN